MGGHLDLLSGRWREDKKKKNKAPEAAVGRAVDAFLRALGGYTRQINSGGTIRGGKWTKGSQGSGISDRLCWLPNSKFIAVELKAQGKKKTTTDAQFDFLTAVICSGAHGCVADGINDVKLCLSQNKQEMLITLNSLKKKKRPRKNSLEPLFP